ncbi:hypothetical protein PsorP6_014833 [Peronosclerospora sorghi]|uniref:Uncharacterized protein n=1 Tax=Peronosclerospora sorghi TaxID=230839 RepID=A0ACC0VS01_9STRA|nr:hypothetical protein PsorP6_014833 [Peronosclerospora sorghi]
MAVHSISFLTTVLLVFALLTGVISANVPDTAGKPTPQAVDGAHRGGSMVSVEEQRFVDVVGEVLTLFRTLDETVRARIGFGLVELFVQRQKFKTALEDHATNAAISRATADTATDLYSRRGYLRDSEDHAINAATSQATVDMVTNLIMRRKDDVKAAEELSQHFSKMNSLGIDGDHLRSMYKRFTHLDDKFIESAVRDYEKFRGKKLAEPQEEATSSTRVRRPGAPVIKD